ncbi:MAG: hypothetical protein OFPII_20650 [Osedax symbiont Rs1]|nr:MAG: hypothetical protein OFPII_20650 [Osedax symbiont Rs1]
MKTLILKVLIVLSLAVSQQVLAIDLQAFNGYKSSLSEQVGRGKWSVVVFWSHSCVICRRETPLLNAFYHQHKNRDARVIGISIDGKKNQRKAELFMRQTQMAFPTFISELPVLAIQFQALSGADFRGTPTFLLFDPNGELVAMQTGPVSMAALERFIGGGKLAEKT